VIAEQLQRTQRQAGTTESEHVLRVTLKRLKRLLNTRSVITIYLLNQKNGRKYGDHTKRDSFCEAIDEARLPEWAKDDSNSRKKIDIS